MSGFARCSPARGRLRPSAQIEPRLNLRKDVGAAVAQSHDEIFAKELEAAIRSRRTGKTKYSSELVRMRCLRERDALRAAVLEPLAGCLRQGRPPLGPT